MPCGMSLRENVFLVMNDQQHVWNTNLTSSKVVREDEQVRPQVQGSRLDSAFNQSMKKVNISCESHIKYFK